MGKGTNYGTPGPMPVYCVSERRAKKRHTCTSCQRIIGYAENYEYIFMVVDRKWDDRKNCDNCRGQG